MTGVDRRAFLGMSVGAVALLRDPLSAAAQTPACVPGGMAQFLPVRLNVDCASRRNFQLFRKYTDDVGLAGVGAALHPAGSRAGAGVAFGAWAEAVPHKARASPGTSNARFIERPPRQFS